MAKGLAGRRFKDDNWREVIRDPSRLRADIRAYLDAENAWTRDHPENRDGCSPGQAVHDEMKGRIKGR